MTEKTIRPGAAGNSSRAERHSVRPEASTGSSEAPDRRGREILKDVIRTFIATGEPVSSRTVAKLERHGLSPASIRNVMADLEDLGFLLQPHTSAGRVPTAAGYHFYIDSLMASRLVPARERRYIRDHLQEAPSEIDKLMGTATHLLTELSSQIGLVMTPPVGETILKAVTFLNLSGRRVLCVVESASGLVSQLLVDSTETLAPEELVRISNYLTENFSGCSLREVRDRLLGLMAEERAQIDRLLSHAISLAQQALGADGGSDLLVEGTSVVLARPELSDLERIRRLLETFSDKAKLVRLLGRMIDCRDVSVVIGEESDLTSELDFSLVATSYGASGRGLGTLGIFGPSRMDYQRIVPLVSYLGESLGRALGETDTAWEDED